MRGLRERVYFDRPSFQGRGEVAVPVTDIKIDASGLKRHLEAMFRVFGGSIQKIILFQARKLCEDMLDYTMPYSPDPPKSDTRAGRNMKAWEAGNKRMGKNIDRVFKPLTVANWYDVAYQDNFSVFVAWYYDKLNAGHELPEWLKERGTIGIGEWKEFQSRYGKAEYESARTWVVKKKGRKKNRFNLSWELAHGGLGRIEAVHREIRGKIDYNTQMKAYNGIYLVGGGQAKIDAYKKQVSKHIGRLKAGWYHAGMALGGKPLKASAWITSQPAGNGIFINNLLDRKEPNVEVGNKLHPNMSKMPGSGMWQTGLNHRAYSMRNAIAKSLNKRTRGTVQEYIQQFNLNGLVISSADQDPF